MQFPRFAPVSSVHWEIPTQFRLDRQGIAAYTFPHHNLYKEKINQALATFGLALDHMGVSQFRDDNEIRFEAVAWSLNPNGSTACVLRMAIYPESSCAYLHSPIYGLDDWDNRMLKGHDIMDRSVEEIAHYIQNCELKRLLISETCRIRDSAI